MVVLGQNAWGFLHAVWTDHWVRKDGQQIEAIVTHIGPKRMLEYRYTVNGRDYAGKDSRDWEDERDHPVNPGDHVAARVSVSHPRLSALGSTGLAWMGLPIFVIICVFELMFLGILLSGILRMFFGFNLVNDQDNPVAGLSVAAFFLVFLVLAALGKRKGRAWQFRVYRKGW